MTLKESVRKELLRTGFFKEFSHAWMYIKDTNVFFNPQGLIFLGSRSFIKNKFRISYKNNSIYFAQHLFSKNEKGYRYGNGYYLKLPLSDVILRLPKEFKIPLMFHADLIRKV